MNKPARHTQADIARAEKAEREMDGEIDKNKELRKSRASAFCEIDNAAYNYAALAARVKALMAVLKQCADELDREASPATKRHYAIAGNPITIARALLAQREGY